MPKFFILECIHTAEKKTKIIVFLEKKGKLQGIELVPKLLSLDKENP